MRGSHKPRIYSVDVLVIISSKIHILTVTARWVAVLATIAFERSRKLALFLQPRTIIEVFPILVVLASATLALVFGGTWGGPLALAFAIVGIIFLIVWMFLQGKLLLRLLDVILPLARPKCRSLTMSIAQLNHRNPIEKFLDDHVKSALLDFI